MIVKSHDIPETQLAQALNDVAAAPFTVRDLQTALEQNGVPASLSYETARRLLQREKKSGALTHDPGAGLWSAPPLSPPPPAPPVPPVQVTTTQPLPSTQNPQNLPTLSNRPGFFHRFQDFLLGLIAHVACLAAVLALVAINASFAREMAETDQFRYALIAGLMASDLMRPMLVARGFWEFQRQAFWRGGFAIMIAVFLSPVSILSSTSVISATLYLGVEEIAQDQSREIARDTLKSEYDRLKLLADHAWQEWQDECDRGYCGPLAAALEMKARTADDTLRLQLAKMLELTETGEETSAFIARTVKAFEDMGLYGDGRRMTVPLLLALTLELAALFGPGLLLARRRNATTP